MISILQKEIEFNKVLFSFLKNCFIMSDNCIKIGSEFKVPGSRFRAHSSKVITDINICQTE